MLGLKVRRKRRGVDNIREQDGQPPDLSMIVGRCSQQVLGLDVPMVDRQHPSSQRGRRGPIATVDRQHRPVKQFIDRRAAHSAGGTVSLGAHLTVAHLKYRAIPRLAA